MFHDHCHSDWPHLWHSKYCYNNEYKPFFLSYNYKGNDSYLAATSNTASSTVSATTSTSTTTTTTTPPATAWIPANYYTSCSSVCTNVTTVTPSTLIASWTFEENANDVSSNGNTGQIINGAAFTTGYIGQAILFQSAFSQYVNVAYVNLYSMSFTVEVWIYLYSLTTSNSDLDIIGECDIPSTQDRCLHYVVRNNQLYLAFYGDDVHGTTNLTTYTWYHAAFVYDDSLNVKSVYLNGVIDGTSTASVNAYLGVFGNVTIGTTAVRTANSYWNGLIDQLTISNRVKTSCEILNDATLVAYFPFDGSPSDMGPNSLVGTYTVQSNNGITWIAGQVNQAINFNASNSYFQSCGFWALGQNQAYSIVMWIKPSFQSGTLFHLSTAATGSGTWCLPMIGFSSNGSLVAQSWNGMGANFVLGPIPPVNAWTHIVQTWSSTNGLRLYINGGLYGSTSISVFSASGSPMCILLGNSGLGINCQTGQISMGSYSGTIDEFYVYSREISALEVCPLAHP